MELKQIIEVLKADRAVCAMLRSMVGCSASPLEIRQMQGRLQYRQVEEEVEKIKRVNITVIASKLDKIERDIAYIGDIDFDVSRYLLLFPVECVPVKPEVQAVVFNDRPLDFTGMSIFNHIANERLPIVLSAGKVIDLSRMPHLLVAGTTGSGKSVFLNVAILSMLYKLQPAQMQLALIDPKRVEFALYRNVPHLYAPIATKLDQASGLLSSLVDEMERRYELLAKHDVKSLEAFNEIASEKLPYIVLVIDEVADLMMQSEDRTISDKITRLAQLARAAGIHIIMATQRPVVDIMTGLIKANMPARVAFRVESKQDSRIILDETGAEKLKGAGELLFKNNGEVTKHQGVWVLELDIKRICGR
jgi:DNA helicase HerA-like ATPase